MLDLIISFLYGFFSCIILFEPILINFVYLFNIDLFLDLILTNKRRSKLIKHILNHYYLDSNNNIIYVNEENV